MAIRLSRRKIAGYIAQQLAADGAVEQLVQQLAAFLIDSRRTNEVSLVVRDIEYELTKQGIVLARATSAFNLTEATRLAVTKLIEDKTGAQQVQLHQFIDPSVIGGVKIDLPGSQLDATIARKLTLLRTNYKK